MNTIEKEIPVEKKEKKEVTNEDLMNSLNSLKEGFGSINTSILKMNQAIVDLTNAFYAFFNIPKGKKGKKKLKLRLANINNLNYDLHNDSSGSSSRRSKTSDDDQPKANIKNFFNEKK